MNTLTNGLSLSFYDTTGFTKVSGELAWEKNGFAGERVSPEIETFKHTQS